MNSKQHGTNTLNSPVIRIEQGGFWLQEGGREYFVSFEQYPIFETATVAEIFDVETPFPGDFHWPQLDADIEIDMLEHPENYPLVARTHQRTK
jgi:hypothetical protein